MIRAASRSSFFMTELRPPIIGLSAICVPPLSPAKSPTAPGIGAVPRLRSVYRRYPNTAPNFLPFNRNRVRADLCAPPSVFSLTAYIDSPHRLPCFRRPANRLQYKTRGSASETANSNAAALQCNRPFGQFLIFLRARKQKKQEI